MNSPAPLSCTTSHDRLKRGPEPLVTVVCWNLFFVGLNVLQIVRIVVARRRERRSAQAAEAA